MLTIPVPRDSHKKKINAVEIRDREWRYKHEETITHNYKRCEYFNKVGLERYWGDNLFGWLLDLHGQVMDTLGMEREIILSRGAPGHKQDLIINLCKHYNADAFLFGAKGRDYVDVHYFEAHGITPLFQDFKCIEYPQQWGGAFVPGLSIIDALFNVGPEKTIDLIKGGYDIPKKY